MRLLTNFKDYYDGVQALGFDDNIVYRRIPEVVNLGHQGTSDDLLTEKLIRVNLPHSRRISNGESWERVVVGVCGKLYLGIRHKTLIPGTWPQKYNHKYYYDTNSLKKAFPGRSASGPKYTPSWVKSYVGYPDLGLFDDNCDEVFVRLGVPIFIYDATAGTGLDYSKREIKVTGIVKNANLKEAEFYKVVPDYQIFQELEMYLGNVLVTRDEIPVMDDKQKIASHGFDGKYGFRTRPKG